MFVLRPAPQWASAKVTYPVPHCSTLVMFSCSRLLSHATSSCLWKGGSAYAIGEGAANAWKFGAAAWALSHLDSPILNVFGGASGWWRRIGESDGRPRGTRSSLGEKRGREGGTSRRVVFVDGARWQRALKFTPQPSRSG